MSRVGNKVIEIPSEVTVENVKNIVTVKGKGGELSLQVSNEIDVFIENNLISLKNKEKTKQSKAKHGLYRALIYNYIIGVSEGFKKELELQGVGYKVQKNENGIELSLGFSHPVIEFPPAGITFEVEGNNKIIISGIDKELVGLCAAKLRALRAPDPYKGKGIRYSGEVIKKKQGKSVKK